MVKIIEVLIYCVMFSPMEKKKNWLNSPHDLMMTFEFHPLCSVFCQLK